MTDFAKIEILHRRLTDERRKVIETAADAEALPPAGLLSRLSDLDSAILAVEAVLEERTGLQASAAIANGPAIKLDDARM